MPEADWAKWCKATHPTELRQFYEGLLSKMRPVARAHGYALAVHGSMERDFDVVAIPWTEDYSSMWVLIEALVELVCAFKFTPAPIKKPQGRTAFLVPLGIAAVLDLSVIQPDGAWVEES